MRKSNHRKTRQTRRLNKRERRALKHKRQANLAIVRKQKNVTGTKIIPRTQAKNCKSPHATVEEEVNHYEDIAAAQIKIWRSLFPSLFKDFSKIKDPRNPNTIKHKITVLLMLGLLQFIFRLPSRRAFNAHLTAPSIMKLLQDIFPDIDSIPHADTIARLLERMDVAEIERIHMRMIKKLIHNKKFKKLLIKKCLPISIDGTQKSTRDGQLQEEGWLLRTVSTKQGKEYQQYVYVLEANITFSNGLNIPLFTEYCYFDDDGIFDDESKQDCELKGFHRLVDRLKAFFPRLKIMILLDNLYACDAVIGSLQKKHWEFMIKLPARVKTLYNLLKEQRNDSAAIPGQPYYRERQQMFHWINHISYKGHLVHLVGCSESWSVVCNKTGNIIKQFSEHTWISSLPLSMDNVHELCNLAARKRQLIEDNFNTEKNRGYQYQHIFSYHWNAMQGFHYLMRLAHAINALSEFTKKLKKYIKTLGWSNTLNTIFSSMKHRWLSDQWVRRELQKTAQIRFDFSSA